jgi:hypothetical protein
MKQIMIDHVCTCYETGTLPEHKGKDEGCQRNYVQEYDGVGCRRILQAIVV